ncbi:6671_t:CDS:1, partial [Funneliformis mosseae]
ILLYNTFNDELAGEYLRTVYEHCPNIKSLSLGVISEFATEFENLLMKCYRLRKIFIQGLTIANIFVSTDLSLLFDILVEIAPDSLHEISIVYRNNVSKDDLEAFFENWRGREPIILNFYVEPCHKLNFEKLISVFEKYEEEGVLKRYDALEDYGDFIELLQN